MCRCCIFSFPKLSQTSADYMAIVQPFLGLNKMPKVFNKESVVVCDEWPQPAVYAEAQVLANEYSLLIRYLTSDNQIAVIRFELCSYFAFGAPNDEAMGGHPLANLGLKYYSVHEVYNSSLILMLEQRNSIHPSHDPTIFFKDKKHYVFTFKDSLLECVVNEGNHWPTQVTVVPTEEEAVKLWRLEK